jgi:hypothetical protein
MNTRSIARAGRLAVAAGLSAALLGLTGTAGATNIGEEGCTPGYWKNHTEDWEESPGVPSASPSTLFSGIFNAGTSGALSGLTFEQALQGGGGPGVAGAELILARAATAAYLNAAHEGVGYPWRRNAPGLGDRGPLVATVRAALLSGDRATILALAQRLDDDNNLGCPL